MVSEIGMKILLTRIDKRHKMIDLKAMLGWGNSVNY